MAIAPLLDASKGKEAVAMFRKIAGRYCAGKNTDFAPDEDVPRERPAIRMRGSEAIELDRVEWKKACPPFPGSVEAIASGSFTGVGRDEVVLVVANGSDRAEGDYSLALMGRDDRYRLRRVMMRSQGFRAVTRIEVPGSQDALFLCEQGGAQGEYHGTCGFFGRGTFRSPGLPTSPVGFDPYRRDRETYAAKNELSLRSVSQCGPSWAVELGKVEPRGDRVIVPVVVETMVKQPGPHDGGECTKIVGKQRRVFEVAYQLGGGGFRRASPIPRALQDVLNRQ